MLRKIDKYNHDKMYINAYFNNYWPFTSKLKKIVSLFFLLLHDDENCWTTKMAVASLECIKINLKSLKHYQHTLTSVY